MDFSQLRANYAELLIRHGLNVQPDQIVNLAMEAIHRDFGVQLAEEAYKAGARFVHLDLIDSRVERMRSLHSQSDSLSFVPKYVNVKYRELVDEVGANLRIVGPEDPDVFTDLEPARLNKTRVARYEALKYFYEEGIGNSKVHWTVAAAATPSWGQRLFPDESPSGAEERLWHEIFKICRVDQPNYLEIWREHDTMLKARAGKLTELGIKSLKFSGPGTNLTVGLSERAIFRAGGDTGPRGVPFECNIPTEECFTTPDYRYTEGEVRVTRPFFINGQPIRELTLTFKSGQIVDFKAETGAAAFGEYISSDPGGSRLGEVALVGIDSPVYRSGLVFEEILFDENAACHIAVGSAYKFCLQDGDRMSTEELKSVGCNESSLHTDMMISSEQVSVHAQTYSGESVALIIDGKWQQ